MPADAPGSVTDLLHESSGGNRAAFDQLLSAVYAELKAMARNRLRVERSGHTLNTTALVHETYLKLVRHERVDWQSRAHFFAVGAQAMRRVLVDHARARNAQRRGGGEAHVPLDSVAEGSPALTLEAADEVLALDDALVALAGFDPRAATVVEYRFFGGLTHAEIATLLGTSEVTVRRSWTTARAWLRRELGPDAVREVTSLSADERSGR